MKFTVNVDCTPEEARTFLGLPDVGPLQNEMLDLMRERMQKAAAVMDPQAMFKSLFPMSPESVMEIQKTFWSGVTGMGVEKSK